MGDASVERGVGDLRRPKNMHPAYAIIRTDDFLDESLSFTVKKIVHTLERAQSEVDRLNKLNGTEFCRYYWQYTRIEKSPLQTADS